MLHKLRDIKDKLANLEVTDYEIDTMVSCLDNRLLKLQNKLNDNELLEKNCSIQNKILILKKLKIKLIKSKYKLLD